jgi:hypothetical protein
MGGPKRNRSPPLVNNTPFPNPITKGREAVGGGRLRQQLPAQLWAEAFCTDTKTTGFISSGQSQKRPHTPG